MSIEYATLLQETANPIIAWLSEYGIPLAGVAVTAGAVIVSIITFSFQKKTFDATAKAEKEKVLLAGLAEAFRLLNDVKHREARKVLYNIAPDWAPRESSFNIICIQPTTSKGVTNKKDLEEVCKDIVKNDCNEIGVLAHYGLVGEDKFIEEGYWVILKVWDLLKKEIFVRRKIDSEHYLKHLEGLRKKACEYAKKK